MSVTRSSLTRSGAHSYPTRLISLLPVALAMLVAACVSGTTTTVRTPSQHTPSPTARAPSPTVSPTPTTVPPPPAPPSVYFRTDDAQLYALNAADGSLRWKVPEQPSSESPVIAHDVVYVQDPVSGTVSALRALDGTALWTAHSDLSFTLAGDILFTITVSNGHDTLAALDALTGQPHWTWQGDTITTDIVTAPEGVYVVSVGHGTPQPGGAPSVVESTLVALDSGSGAVRWSFPRTAESLGDPVVSAGTLYVPANTQIAGHVYALGASDGMLEWTADTVPYQFRHTLDVANELVYGSGSSEVYALRASDGRQVWQFEQPRIANTLVAGTVIYVTKLDDGINPASIFALDAANGTRRWSELFSASALNAPPVAASGHVFIPTRNFFSGAAGYFFAFNESSGAIAWTFLALDYPVVDGETLYDDVSMPSGSTIYAFAAASGTVKWHYSLTAHLRTSLALGS